MQILWDGQFAAHQRCSRITRKDANLHAKWDSQCSLYCCFLPALPELCLIGVKLTLLNCLSPVLCFVVFLSPSPIALPDHSSTGTDDTLLLRRLPLSQSRLADHHLRLMSPIALQLGFVSLSCLALPAAGVLSQLGRFLTQSLFTSLSFASLFCPLGLGWHFCAALKMTRVQRWLRLEFPKLFWLADALLLNSSVLCFVVRFLYSSSF